MHKRIKIKLMMKGMGHHDWSWLCGGFVVEWIEGLVVMRRITCAQVVVAAIAVGCLLSPPQVLAQTTGTASAVPSSVGGLDGQCPKMQFVVVNSAADSFDDSGADTGFLGGVVGPVVRDAMMARMWISPVVLLREVLIRWRHDGDCDDNGDEAGACSYYWWGLAGSVETGFREEGESR